MLSRIVDAPPRLLYEPNELLDAAEQLYFTQRGYRILSQTFHELLGDIPLVPRRRWLPGEAN